MTAIAGYRVVRKLGAGSRAVVYLGHGGGPGTADESDTVAIKVYNDGVDASSIDREVAALSVESAHLVRLLDIAAGTARSGGAGVETALVLERPQGGTLAQLIRRRDRWEPGEAVTVLASSYAAIRDLQESGYAHGRLSANQVLFDESGRPVVIGVGHCARLETPHGRPLEPDRHRLGSSAAEDYARLAGIAHLLLEPIGGASVREFLEAADAVRQGDWLDEVRSLEDLVFGIAAAAPVDLATHAAADAGIGAVIGYRGRVGEYRQFGAKQQDERAGEPEASQAQTAGPIRSLFARMFRGLLFSRILQSVQRSLDGRPLQSIRQLLAASLARTRKPLIIGAALAVGIVVLALSALPADGDKAQTAHPPESAAPTTGATPAKRPLEVTGDDPVAAASMLLAMRASCLATTSLACLAGTDQADSGILDEDRERVAQAHTGSTTFHAHYSGKDCHLIQRSGDSALIQTSATDAGTVPASVLLIKGGSGWRLRDLFVDGPVTGRKG